MDMPVREELEEVDLKFSLLLVGPLRENIPFEVNLLYKSSPGI